ncbi:MAG: alanine racemase [Gammaproteobacteria bacterium]
MRRSAYALIRLENLAHNLNILRTFASNSKIISVVKADAYGHGLAKTAQALAQSDAFAVSCANEAAELRAARILHPIICLQGFSNEAELKIIADANVQAVIHSDHQIKLLQNQKLNQSIQVWLKIDTGMGRLGFRPEDARYAYQQLEQIKSVSKIRLMTHFANADSLDNDSTQHQLKLFDNVTKGFPGCERSAANSAATLAYSNSLYEWVRSGLALYGVSPFHADKTQPDTSELKPVMSLRAPLISTKQCKQGDKIGYGSTYTCPREMRVGVVAIGYADGYPRSISNTVNVSLNGNLAPVIGRVSMDMITIDLSHTDANIGDDAELWGDDISISDIANAANTISYELLCGISGRIHREYE